MQESAVLLTLLITVRLLRAGHYVSYVNSHGNWLFFDDEEVQLQSEANVQTSYGSAQVSKACVRHLDIQLHTQGIASQPGCVCVCVCVCARARTHTRTREHARARAVADNRLHDKLWCTLYTQAIVRSLAAGVRGQHRPRLHPHLRAREQQ